MTKILVVLLASVYVASGMSDAEVERLADAIWAAEGKNKARTPYGVLSVPVRGAAHAREVCLRTIRNSWTRFEAAGRPGDFIEHLGATYCPTKGTLTVNERKLNSNWVKNVRFFVSRPR